ncbi:MAG TPA: hypothetical protein VE076_03795 [Nitrososphaeraceae archaeon]|nr:hypothetical protein [Nitrososphaeraceae archaeon]
MAEPRTSLHTWKRSIILLVVVLVNILPVRLYAVKIRRPESGYTAASNQLKSVGAGIVGLVVDSHGDAK